MIVQADASLRGLGACLIQDGKPMAFTSKSLTGVESRYANIERELLAVRLCMHMVQHLLARVQVHSSVRP